MGAKMVVALVTQRSKKISIYSDFKKDLEISPLSLDLTVFKDEDSIKESITNILLTDRGERLMQPNIGGNIRAMLFENITPGVLTLIEDQVRTTLDLHEPRAEIIDVTVTSIDEDNVVRIRIQFYILNNQQPISVDVFLERTR
jgi:phage baseplate assembly protein W|tara:strand:+ start:6516 stop:6944 length:429 start_codon:yes stop_codon:yes gene_type:complete